MLFSQICTLKQAGGRWGEADRIRELMNLSGKDSPAVSKALNLLPPGHMKLRGVKRLFPRLEPVTSWSHEAEDSEENPGCSWVQIQDKVQAFIVGQRLEGLDPCLSLEGLDPCLSLDNTG
ncbi:hypothetical protein FXO38_21762 [Capsicum annuum]|nr:hypothetical protein FXO38_21762 [Capsicum annuum]KAF3657573.1 hypothetical protein FXO37_14858 [Capsicum annuum]